MSLVLAAVAALALTHDARRSLEQAQPDPRVARQAQRAAHSMQSLYRELEESLRTLGASPSLDVSSCALAETELIRQQVADAQGYEVRLDAALRVSDYDAAVLFASRIDASLSDARHHRTAADQCLRSAALRNFQRPTQVEVVPPDGVADVVSASQPVTLAPLAPTRVR